MKKLIFAIAVMAAGAAMAVTIAYQGALKNADGSAVSGEPSMPITFRLYNSPTSDDLLWARTVNVLLNGEGLFNVELSDTSGSNPAPSMLTNTLDSVLATCTENLFIGLYVEGSTGEIRPRQKLLSVPMAAYAQDVSKAKNNFEVSGHAKIKNGLEMTGDAAINGNVNVAGTLTVKGGIEEPDRKTLSFNSPIEFSENAKLANGVTLSAVSNTTVSIENGAKLVQDGEVGGIVPQGGIIMWSGAADNIPKGWALCDGRKINDMKIPDLRGRFIVGENNSTTTRNTSLAEYAHGACGGEENHQLSIKEMPAHMHLSLAESLLDGKFGDNDSWKDNALRYQVGRVHAAGSARGDHPGGLGYQWHSDNDQMIITETGMTGGDGTKEGKYPVEGHAEAHENRPPYYALCFIIKL